MLNVLSANCRFKWQCNVHIVCAYCLKPAMTQASKLLLRPAKLSNCITNLVEINFHDNWTS